MLTVEPLNIATEPQYEGFVRTHPSGLLYYSLKWRDVTTTVTGGKARYLICRDNHRIVGVMPAFLFDGAAGRVLNSLPFYGSHGGPLVDESTESARHLMLKVFDNLARDNNCVSSTFITNPFDPDRHKLGEMYPHSFVDERIGHITEIPPGSDEKSLFTQYEGRARTAIRKAINEGITVRIETNPTVLEKVWRLHRENIETLGGIPKPWSFFEAVRAVYDYGVDYEVFTALKNDTEIAYLLLFYYSDKVEYFTPCVDARWRSCQPMSLLIFEGMKRASARDHRYWNFGGTLATQEGVARFKRSFGAQEYPYHYYGHLFDDKLMSIPRETILEMYPFVYVYPFALKVRP